MMRLFLLALGIAVVIGGLLWLGREPGPPPASSSLVLGAPAEAIDFARVTQVRDFRFPEDHGPHLDFQTEWWYYTGNLDAKDGSHFAYQLTFFRRGLTPGSPERRASLATNQIYFAHFALTDVDGGEHTFSERFSRGVAELAGAGSSPYRVWLEDWSVQAMDTEGGLLRLQAREGDMAVDLVLRAAKPIVRQGLQGLSPKSEAPGNASYYLSYTRMWTEGRLHLNDVVYEVVGESWFDHEWSTSALGEQAVGWDWFGLQLDDGRELMYGQIRHQDGTIESVSGGTLIEPDGATRSLSAEDVDITVLSQWRSPNTGVEYPSAWRLEIPSEGIRLTLEPWLQDQEMVVLFSYWEGAVRVVGTSAGQAVTGNGFVELTGYDDSLQGLF